MKKNKILKALIVAALITGVYGTVNAETGNIVDITINQQHEKTGIELGENSYARGEGSITTGINSIAIGKKATATGGNESHESITQKLQENEQKLQEIEAKKANIQKLSKELNDLKIKEHDVIEAGIRVEQIRKAKANAKNVWDNAETAWKDKVDGTADAIAEHNRKLADLNSRLTGVSKLTNSDISSPEGLGKAAKELKGIVEKDTTLNLSIDFYKDYVNNYYKALGDLREKNKIYNNIGSGNVKIIDFIKENPLKVDMSDIVIQYEYSNSSSSSLSLIHI